MSNAECRDMLVNLHQLPDIAQHRRHVEAAGILIRRALVLERGILRNWIASQFWPSWVDECDAAFAGHPVRCLVATTNHRLIGFCVYDSIALGTIGPVGIDPEFRRAKIGRVLFVETLETMRNAGYAYAVAAWAAPQLFEYFRTIAGAQLIPDSAPDDGMYKDMLTTSSK